LNLRQNFLRTFIALFVLAVFLVIIIDPQAHVDPLVSLGIVLTLDVAAFAVSFLVFKGGKVGQFIRLTMSSALLAGFFVYFLAPASTLVQGFDQVFLSVFIIETASLVLAWWFGRPGGGAGPR
jgi:hypothetical protein